MSRTWETFGREHDTNPAILPGPGLRHDEDAAVRAALVDAARERTRSALRAEAEALAADEQDRAEAAQVLRDMESLRAW